MLNVLLVLPGSTELDRQGRIKGSLNLPLNSDGNEQVRRTAEEIEQQSIDMIYCSPCLAARQTAERISRGGSIRVKAIGELQNLDHGLWHGKRINELKSSQPRVYRLWQDHPDTICPPDGESLREVRARIRKAVNKITRKHRRGTIALVVPEPAASLLRCQLENVHLGDMWKAECRCGGWESIAVNVC